MIKFFLLIFLFLSSLSVASTEGEARKLFERYITSFGNKDLTNLLSTMDSHFLKETGGKDHWKEVIEAFGKDYKGAKVEKVEFLNVRGLYLARFNFSTKKKKAEPLSDKWFELVLINGQLYIHDLVDHFNPEEKEK